MYRGLDGSGSILFNAAAGMREGLPRGEAGEGQTRGLPPSCLFDPPERTCAPNARSLGPASLVEDLHLQIARSVPASGERDGLMQGPERTGRGQARRPRASNRLHASVAV